MSRNSSASFVLNLHHGIYLNVANLQLDIYATFNYVCVCIWTSISSVHIRKFAVSFKKNIHINCFRMDWFYLFALIWFSDNFKACWYQHFKRKTHADTSTVVRKNNNNRLCLNYFNHFQCRYIVSFFILFLNQLKNQHSRVSIYRSSECNCTMRYWFIFNCSKFFTIIF